MLTIKTTVNKTNKGVTVTARCKGKQKTVPWDDRMGIQANHASAAAQAANRVITREQAAKIHHPSGRQRFTIATFNNGTGVITLDV
jgi:hypothetical protein